MSPRPRGRSGVFLVRVWLEEETLLRARITETVDLVGGGERVTLVDDVGEAERRLEEWFAAFDEREAPE